MSDIYRVILPKSFLRLQIQETVLAVFLVGFHLLVMVVVALGESVDLLCKVFKRSHCARIMWKDSLDSHVSRIKEWNHSFRGQLTDQSHCIDLSLVEGGTRVKGRLLGRRGGRRRPDGWMDFIFIVLFYYS